MKSVAIGSAISTPNWRISQISRNSTFPEIRARASGSGPTRQNLSPDLRIWARAGRAAISIPTPLFYENHGIPENRIGYIHSKLKDFRDFQKFHFSGNPSPSIKFCPHASDPEPMPARSEVAGRAGSRPPYLHLRFDGNLQIYENRVASFHSSETDFLDFHET